METRRDATIRLMTTRTPERPASSGVRVDHGRIIDGFGELSEQATYEPYEVQCGLCDARFAFSPREQKYVHEVRRVPIKMARRGAAYCQRCVPKAAARNAARAQNAERQRDVQRTTLALREHPGDPELRLKSVISRILLLELEPSRRSAVNISEDLARVRRSIPESAELARWEARLQQIKERFPPSA